MKVTNIEDQQLRLKNKVKVFFHKSIANKKKRGFCITKDIMAAILDKWSLLIIYNLAYHHTLRFNALKKNINGISSRMLSVSLKKLEEKEVIVRQAFAEVPPRVEYKLSDFGLELAEKTVEMNAWFLEHFIKEEVEKT